MPSISSLAVKLQSNYQDYAFIDSEDFHWSPEQKTIFYDGTSEDYAALLHELAHALLHHTSYKRDIHLLELEREAWEYARQHLTHLYSVTITDDIIEDALDTYRDWLHARSMCPSCKATGIQTRQNEYKCVVCPAKWHVNDARSCALRRHVVSN